MVRIVASGKYRIYVYAGEKTHPHHGAHAHVYWPDGSAVVSLPDRRVLQGAPLPREVLALVEEHIAALMRAWEELNP